MTSLWKAPYSVAILTDGVRRLGCACAVFVSALTSEIQFERNDNKVW